MDMAMDMRIIIEATQIFVAGRRGPLSPSAIR
jgi:hypothetical protein